MASLAYLFTTEGMRCIRGYCGLYQFDAVFCHMDGAFCVPVQLSSYFQLVPVRIVEHGGQAMLYYGVEIIEWPVDERMMMLMWMISLMILIVLAMYCLIRDEPSLIYM